MARNTRELVQNDHFHARVPTSAKDSWKQVARLRGQSLSQWVIETLNEAARKQLANGS